MAWPFSRTNKAPVRPATKEDDNRDPAELNGHMDRKIQEAIEKTLSGDYWAALGSNSSEGGYFSPEFDIITTIGRIKALYAREPWIWAGSQLIAKTLASIPFKVVDTLTEEPVDNHPLEQILRTGGRWQDALHMKWSEYLDLGLAGNGFIVFDDATYKDKAHVPAERVTLIFDDIKQDVVGIRIFDENVGNGVSGMGRDVPIELVVHHKLSNPYTPFIGMSPFTAAARPILLDRYKAEFEMAFYLRGGSNSGVIEMSEDLSRSRLRRLQNTFEQAFTGRSNWWRTIFLPRGAKWVNSSLTMSEMQHLEGLKENRKTILAVLGIPPAMLGLVEDVNRNTSDQQEAVFYNNTIIPMAWFIASGWNDSHLVKQVYRGAVKLIPDFSNIEAVEGSVAKKGESAKHVEPYLLINEIRELILGIDPLPEGDKRGNMFVSEIRPALVTQMLPPPVASDPEPDPEPDPKPPDPDDVPVKPDDDLVDETELEEEKAQRKAAIKAGATSSQNRVEGRLSKDMDNVFGDYVDLLITHVRQGLERHVDMDAHMETRRTDRLDFWTKNAGPIMSRAMDRGFSMANAQIKFHVANTKQVRFTGLDQTDQQAIDVLKDKQDADKRAALTQRNNAIFLGMDEHQTNQAMGIIEEGFRQGESFSEISRTLRERYGEQYKNQANTIVRTEILSAVSQGIEWNHEVLGEVFSDVRKQWLHQGDSGINPDARDEHVAFEELGAVPSDFKWGDELGFPRDPAASAGQIINCRCTMVTVIPDTAHSNAEAILEMEL